MIGKFLERRKKAKALKLRQAYERGYDYAAGRLLRGHSALELSELIPYRQPQISDTCTKFDQGMEAAIDECIKLGIVEDDRI